MSRTRLNLARPSKTPSASGSAPPESEVPAPRGTTLMPSVSQSLRNARDLGGGLGQHAGERRLAVGAQAVALVGLEGIRIGDHALARNDGAKRGDDRRLTGDHGGIGLRHPHQGALRLKGGRRIEDGAGPGVWQAMAVWGRPCARSSGAAAISPASTTAMRPSATSPSAPPSARPCRLGRRHHQSRHDPHAGGNPKGLARRQDDSLSTR